MKTAKKKRLVGILTGFVFLLLVLPILLWAVNFVRDIYPKSSSIHLQKPLASRFWEQRGLHKRECEHVRWFFVAVAEYEPTEILQHYQEMWKREARPPHPALVELEYQGRFFAIFNIHTSNFELSMEKYLGYTTQSVPQKEYTIGTHLYVCRLEDWYE